MVFHVRISSTIDILLKENTWKLLFVTKHSCLYALLMNFWRGENDSGRGKIFRILGGEISKIFPARRGGLRSPKFPPPPARPTCLGLKKEMFPFFEIKAKVEDDAQRRLVTSESEISVRCTEPPTPVYSQRQLSSSSGGGHFFQT